MNKFAKIVIMFTRNWFTLMFNPRYYHFTYGNYYQSFSVYIPNYDEVYQHNKNFKTHFCFCNNY